MKFDILHIAEYGTLDEMKEAIKEGSNINLKDKDDGGTLLMSAIAYANTDIALFLIENGADASIQDNEGNNALHYAVEHNMIDVAKHILNKFPETLNVKNTRKATVLWKAVMNPKMPLDFIEYLLQQGADKVYTDSLVKEFNEDELTKLFERY